MVKEQRMCSVAMRHLSGIQKGIQAAHAIVDYALKYGDTPEYQRWAKKDKTLYVLEANTTEQLEEAVAELKKVKIPVMEFREPDLGNVVTAITFLLDEPIWNTKDYPDGTKPSDLAIRRMKNRFNLASN